VERLPTLVIQDATEEYNGATWTSNPTGLNTARKVLQEVQELKLLDLAFGGIASPFTCKP
jgi:hypothetical protein